MDKFTQELTEMHANTWVDKPQWFWFISLLEEIWELGWALLGLHKDPPELELAQIAGIVINWRRHRTQDSSKQN